MDWRTDRSEDTCLMDEDFLRKYDFIIILSQKMFVDIYIGRYGDIWTYDQCLETFTG